LSALLNFLVQVIKSCTDFSPENAPKAFGGRDPPGPIGELTALIQTSLLDLRGKHKHKGMQKGKTGREGQGMRGGEGGKGREEKELGKGEEKGE